MHSTLNFYPTAARKYMNVPPHKEAKWLLSKYIHSNPAKVAVTACRVRFLAAVGLDVLKPSILRSVIVKLN